MEVVSDLMDPPAGGEREERFLFPCGERARASPLPVVTSYESVARKLHNHVVLEWRGMRSARVETAQSTAPDRSGFRKGYWFASRSARPSRDDGPTRAKEEDSKRRRAADAVLRAPRRRMGVRQSIGARQSPC